MSENENLGPIQSITAEREDGKWFVSFLLPKIAAMKKGQVIIATKRDTVVVDAIHFEDVCGDVNVVQSGEAIGAEELGESTQCLVFNISNLTGMREAHLYCTGNHDFFESMRKRYKLPKMGEDIFVDEEKPEVPAIVVESRGGLPRKFEMQE